MKDPSLLAFKSDVQSETPSDGKKDDLYLKGQGYVGGKKVDFDETYEEEGDAGGKRKHLWQLIVFKDTRTTWIQTVHGGLDWGGREDEQGTCEKGWFDVETPTYGSTSGWEKAVAKVKFKLSRCSNAGGRRECDIEIEDSVGWEDFSF